MDGIAKQKVAGGKLVTVKLQYSGRVDSIRILGDFFIHPESGLEQIERALVGENLDETALSSNVARTARENGIEMIGVTPEAIASTIMMAVKR